MAMSRLVAPGIKTAHDIEGRQMPPRQGILERLRPKSPRVSRSLAAERTTGLSAKLGPTAILFPLRAVSASDREGQPFDDSVARMALLDALRSNRAGVPLVELDYHINDPEFADAAAHRLLELLRQASTPSSLQAST
jgi:uncharacterized protein (UPF0261 family)